MAVGMYRVVVVLVACQVQLGAPYREAAIAFGCKRTAILFLHKVAATLRQQRRVPATLLAWKEQVELVPFRQPARVFSNNAALKLAAKVKKTVTLVP